MNLISLEILLNLQLDKANKIKWLCCPPRPGQNPKQIRPGIFYLFLFYFFFILFYFIFLFLMILMFLSNICLLSSG